MTLSNEAVALAFFLFSLRVINSAVGTLRLIVMARGRRILTAIFGFFEALIFAYVTANIVTDLSNLLNLSAYCLGFSVGLWVGMVIEERYVTSYVKLNIISPVHGHEIATALRQLGHGVTEVEGHGVNGQVTMLNSVVLRRDVPEMLKSIYAIHRSAFVTMEEARLVQHGWLRPNGMR